MSDSDPFCQCSCILADRWGKNVCSAADEMTYDMWRRGQNGDVHILHNLIGQEGWLDNRGDSASGERQACRGSCCCGDFYDVRSASVYVHLPWVSVRKGHWQNDVIVWIMRKTTAWCVYEPSSLPRLSTQNMLISTKSSQFVIMTRVGLEMRIIKTLKNWWFNTLLYYITKLFLWVNRLFTL